MNLNNLSETNKDQTKINSLEWYAMLGILALVAFIYAPVVTNAFNGDDFVHLKWLHQAISQPELIWRNFHSSWLDLTTAKFYRPLISIFMLADYMAWHNNGIGFHLTNLLCHLINTLFVWLVLRSILARQSPEDSSRCYLWCISAAALFGLYPLHPEAVSWITGRVDVIVTLFFLGSFLGYIEWQRSRKYKYLLLSLLSFICCLLSKEMAIVLPPVIFIYELIYLVSKTENISATISSGRLTRIIISAFKESAIFWGLLFVYFLWRAYALGTLIGGYDSTLLPGNSWRLLISLWKKSLSMLFIPFNRALLPNYRYIILWVILLLISAFSSIKKIFFEKESKNNIIALVVFLCFWLVLSLIPVYKLFNIEGDLQGSRLAYLATVPLCMLICFGLSIGNLKNNKINYLQTIILIVLLSNAGAVLLINNSAWIKAESASHAIVEQLDELSKTNAVQSANYIIGLPDQINGAYVCRNALDGMTKYPQISADIHNAFNLSEIDHIFPFGYALRSTTDITSSGPLPQLYVWLPIQQKLQQFHLSIKEAISPEKIWSGKNLTENICLNIDRRPCNDIQFLQVDYNPDRQLAKNNKSPMTLIYKNDLHPEGISQAALPSSPQNQIIFPLHGQADWILGGKCQEAKLHLNAIDNPAKSTMDSVTIVPTDKIMPNLSFKNAANQYIVGYIELDSAHPSCKLDYDVSKIPGAQSAVFELTQPNRTFAVANDPCPPYNTSPLKKLPLLSGSVALSKADFPEPGIYELRLLALKPTNPDTDIHKLAGVAGDHIIITVR